MACRARAYGDEFGFEVSCGDKFWRGLGSGRESVVGWRESNVAQPSDRGPEGTLLGGLFVAVRVLAQSAQAGPGGVEEDNRETRRNPGDQGNHIGRRRPGAEPAAPGSDFVDLDDGAAGFAFATAQQIGQPNHKSDPGASHHGRVLGVLLRLADNLGDLASLGLDISLTDCHLTSSRR